MSGPENSERFPGPEQAGRFGEGLEASVKEMEKDAEVLGIGLGVAIEVEGEGEDPDGTLARRRVVDVNSDLALHPASTFKLITAARVMDKFRGSPDRLLRSPDVLSWEDWPEEALIRDGAGIYGKDGSPRQASIRSVIYDMLSSNSGNMANKALIGYTDEDIVDFNTYCLDRGFATEESPAIKRTGKYGIGFCDRTPEELLRVMRTMPSIGQEGNSALDEAVSDALKTAATRKGTVRGSVVTPEDAVGFLRPFAADQPYIQCKTGELNPDDEIDSFLRHDVGRIDMRDGRKVNYAITTSSPVEFVMPRKAKLFVAKRYISAIGAMMGSEAGLPLREGGRVEDGLARAATWFVRASQPVKDSRD